MAIEIKVPPNNCDTPFSKAHLELNKMTNLKKNVAWKYSNNYTAAATAVCWAKISTPFVLTEKKPGRGTQQEAIEVQSKKLGLEGGRGRRQLQRRA